MDSPFKRMLEEDNKRVFLNPIEFGEEHQLDGISYNIVVDNDQLEEWRAGRLSNGVTLPESELSEGEIYIFIASDDYPEPAINQVVRFDGRPYRAKWTMIANGMLEMVLGGVE